MDSSTKEEKKKEFFGYFDLMAVKMGWIKIAYFVEFVSMYKIVYNGTMSIFGLMEGT